jgi:uncharacterized HAD superfamily protein
MKIGCDVDDVTVEFVPSYLEAYKKRYSKEFREEDIYSFDLWKPLGISKEAAIELNMELFNSPVYDNLNLVEGAKKGLGQLAEKNELFLMTARPSYAEEKTRNYFKKRFPEVDLPIYFTGDFFDGTPKKSDLCKKIGITLIIEDNWEIALDCLEKNIGVLLYDHPWNKCFEDTKHKNIKRVYDWEEILREINKKNGD